MEGVEAIRILLGENDDDSRQQARAALQQAGMTVLQARDGLQAMEVWRTSSVHVAVLNFRLPGLDGLELCRRIRSVANVPVIMLVAQGGERQVIAGFEAGADDVMVKPVSARELVARVRAILRRIYGFEQLASQQIARDDLVLDIDRRRVVIHKNHVRVTPLEFQLLHYFMQRKGMVVTKHDLLQNVWRYAEASLDTNFIEAAIKRLRKKIEANPAQPQYIQTIWGVGYRLGQ
jgi:two-component system response regulator MtrA